MMLPTEVIPDVRQVKERVMSWIAWSGELVCFGFKPKQTGSLLRGIKDIGDIIKHVGQVTERVMSWIARSGEQVCFGFNPKQTSSLLGESKMSSKTSSKNTD